MKRYLNLLFMMALSLSTCYLCYSCEDDKVDEGGTGGTTTPITPDNNPTPIKWEVEEVDGGDRGVGIKVTSKTTNNFVFECTPGKYVQSYKLDVYPLSRMYNYLFEEWKKDNNVDIDELIKEALYNSTGSGGYLFTKERLSEKWNKTEFDWANSIYSQAQIVPDAAYLIITIGCNDEAGERPADMKICYVETEMLDLIGSPEIDIDVTTSYKGFAVQFEPNADCKYFYQFSIDSEQIDDFINAYGQKMYEDFIRHTTTDASSVEGKTKEDLYIPVPLGASANPDKPIAATAIALDENRTPGKYIRKDFNLKKIPADAKPAETTLEISKIGASIIHLRCTMSPENCLYSFFNVIPKSEWDRDYANASEETLKALADKLDREGWSIKNAGYGTDNESYTTETMNYPLVPNTEYVAIYVGRNQYQQVSDVKVTAPFTTKPRTLIGGNSKASARLEITNPSRTSLFVGYHFNTETAMFYHQYILDETLLAEGNEEALVKYLISDEANKWVGKGNEYDSWDWKGLDPGTKYTFAMVSEDWDGVLTPVAIAEKETEKVVAGPNPEMKINWLMDANKEWAVQFALVKDVAYYYHFVGEDTYSTNPKYTYEDCAAVWKEQCLGEIGIKSYNTTPFVPYAAATKTNKRSVAVCVPIGANEDGSEKIGDLYLLFYDKEKGIMSVEQVFPDAFPKANKVKNTVKPQVVKKDAEVFGEQFLNTPQVRKTENVVKDSQTETIYLDMKQLAKNPHSRYILK